MNDKRFPHQWWSSGQTKKNRVAILLKAHSPCKAVSTIAEVKGRLLALRLQWGNIFLTVASIYAKNEHQESFLRSSLSAVMSSPDRAVLIGGDLNIVMNPDIDRSGQRSNQSGTLSADGRRWLADCGMIDVWRHLHPQTRDYTYFSAAHKSYARLDHFLASSTLLPDIRSADIQARSLSDHALVLIMLSARPSRTSAPTWRLRDSLLHPAAKGQRLRNTILHYLEENDTGETALAAVWEALKLVARGELISIAAAYSTLRKTKRAELEKQVSELEAVHKRTGAPRVWRELESRRKMLKHLDIDRVEHTL